MTRSFSGEFAYNLWTPNTELTLSNVPWANGASDIVLPTNRQALDSFINSRPGTRTIQFANLARANEPIVVDLLYTEVEGFNYIRATNKEQAAVPGSVSRSYYYFILGARHTATHTTELILQLDVWHTYFDRVNFGSAYVEQGHYGVAAENAFSNYGRDFLTVPEGLDIGTDYQNKRIGRHNALSAYSILVASTLDLEGDLGSNEKTAKYPAAKGTRVQQLVTGLGYYVFDNYATFLTYLGNLSTKGWVSQSIVSITAIPNMASWVPGWSDRPTIPALANAGRKAPSDKIEHKEFAFYQNWRDRILETLPSRYQHFKKFLTSPYCIIQMSTGLGQALVLKPENWNDPDGTYRVGLSIVPPGQRLSYYPLGYNRPGADSGGSLGNDGGDYLDVATSITGFPSFSGASNSASAALASSMGGLAFAEKSAEWAFQRNMESSRVSYDQQGKQIDLASTLTDLQNQSIREGRAIADEGGVIGAGISTVAGIPNLQLGETLTAGFQAANASAMANKQAALEQRMNSQSARLTGQNAEYLRDTNKKLSDYGARGDHALAIAAIDARQRDIAATPPSVIGQVGGEIFNMVAADGGLGVTLRIKMIDDGAIRRIGEHWIRYGYAIHQRVSSITSLHCMSHFTYWRLQELYLIDTDIPEGFKNVIIGMFMKGVTVWKNPNDIGRIDMGINTPLEGIAL